MSLIEYKSTLSNYRRVIKPEPTSDSPASPVPFGEYKPVSNTLNSYQDDRYSFNTKKLESFERKKINESFEKKSLVEKESIFDNDNIVKKDLSESSVVNHTQLPLTKIDISGNNEASPFTTLPSMKDDDKSLQATTVQPIKQEDKTLNLSSQYTIDDNVKRIEPMHLEKINSIYDKDDKKSISDISGRYDSERESRFGFLNNKKPFVDAFSNKFNVGFKIKDPSGFTQTAYDYAWAGGSDRAPVVGGFLKFSKLGNTEFKEENLPKLYTTDYFANTYNKNFKSFQTNTQFTDAALSFTKIKAVDYFSNTYQKNFKIKQTETSYTNDGLRYGLNNLKSVDYFDTQNLYTSTGFTTNQNTYETDFNRSALDWGLKGTIPATNYFDQTDKYTQTGFDIRQSIYQTDFNKSALDWGLQGQYPTTNYFDRTNQFTQTGFTFKQPIYQSDFNVDALDWGLQGQYPTTNYFDQTNQFTQTGFTFKQPTYQTDFNTTALDWGLQGQYPTTNYFDRTNQFTQTGFTFKQPTYQTDFNTTALDWGLQGQYPTTNYFDQNNQFTQTGFTFKQSIYQTDFNGMALDWGLQNQYPTTNYFDQNNQFTQTGFTFKQPTYQTDFNTTALDWGLQGQYPTTNYFDQSNQFTQTGFTFKQSIYQTDFNTTALDWGLQGQYPTTNYFDQTNQFTQTGFTFKQPTYQTDFNTTALDWGLQGQYPTTNYFDQTNQFTQTGFTFRQQIRKTDFTNTALDFSLANIPPLESGLPSVNVVSINSKNYQAVDFFDLNKVNTTQGFHVFATPLEPTSYKTDSTRFFNVPASDFEISRIGSPVHKLDSQLVRSPIFLNVGFIKQNSNSYSELIRTRNFKSFLGDIATRRNSPSLLDIQYEKYDLKEESTNTIQGILPEIPLRFNADLSVIPGLPNINVNTRISLLDVRQPYIIRGIQKRGQIENERWGFGSTFDDGLIRGGISTAVDRAANDASRLLRWMSTIKGVLYITKQTGLELSNPITEASSGLVRGILTGKKLYNPISPIINAATSPFGLHFANRRFDIDTYEEVVKNRMSDFFDDPLDSSRNIEIANELSLLSDITDDVTDTDRKSILIDRRSIEPVGSIIDTISGLGGPNSLYGIGFTSMRRNSVSIPVDAIQKYNTRFQYAAILGNSNVSNLDVLKNDRPSQWSSRLASILKAFSAETTQNVVPNVTSVFIKQGTAEPSLLNFGLVGENQSVKAFKSSIQNQPEYQLPLRDLYSPNTVRNPFNLTLSRNVVGEAFSKAENIFNPLATRNYAVMDYASIPRDYPDPSRGDIDVSVIRQGGAYRSPTLANGSVQNREVVKFNLNSAKFYDFRYKVHKFISNDATNLYPPVTSRVNFVTNPEIIKYRSNNLETKVGFGTHGVPGVNRTNPVLSMLCGRVSQGVRRIEGGQYGGEYTFRGDRVNLIDFRHDKSITNINEIYELGDNALIPGTKDLVEFYVTGTGKRDRVIVFRATITDFADNFNPSWDAVKYLNRADPAYIYKGFERDVSLSFDVGITSRDELRTRWRSLNALAGFTTPEYITSTDSAMNGRMKAPLMKLTLGNLFRATPCIITSLSYTFDNSQVVWETAKLTRWVNGREIEETITTTDLDDPACCVALQLPKMIRVTMNLKIIGNYRPQSNGGANGYPDMGIFYQLYANDDGNNDGQLPRRGGIYVNYFNRECSIIRPQPEQPKLREEIQPTKFKEEAQPTKEEIKKNVITTTPSPQPLKDTPETDPPEIKKVQEEEQPGKGEGIAKRQGPSSTKKPRRTNSDGTKAKRDVQPNPPSKDSVKKYTNVFSW